MRWRGCTALRRCNQSRDRQGAFRCLEGGQHGPERLAAMADGELLFRRRFAEGAPKSWTVKERVVPEAARSAGFVEDSAFHCAAIHAEQARAFHQSDGADEAGGPVLNGR